MTLTHPFAYWQRNNSYANDFALPNTHVYNRNSAANTSDLHVRSYLHSRVTVTIDATTPPPVDWFAGIDILQQAMWSIAPITIMGSANSGAYGMMLTAPLVLVGNYPIGSPGVDVAVWSSQKVESARVYHRVGDDNPDYPSVQSGLTITDLAALRDPDAGYTYTVTVHQYLETLWASKVPPP